MAKFTLYYKNKNGDRISVYTFTDYDLAVAAWGKSQELSEIAKNADDVIFWHLMDDTEETVLF